MRILFMYLYYIFIWCLKSFLSVKHWLTDMEKCSSLNMGHLCNILKPLQLLAVTPNRLPSWLVCFSTGAHIVLKLQLWYCSLFNICKIYFHGIYLICILSLHSFVDNLSSWNMTYLCCRFHTICNKI